MNNKQKPDRKITDYFNIKQIRSPLAKVLTKPGISSIHSVNTKYSNDQNRHRVKNLHKNEVQLQIQSNGTQIIQQSEKKVNKIIHSCKQQIMIGPCDVNYFSAGQYRLKKVLQQYSKQNLLKYLLGNTKFHNIDNLAILIDIKEEIFWNKTLPKMMQYSLNNYKQKSISSCIPMMITGFSNFIQISKAQILMILINMFFCILPGQSHKQYLSFAWLMGTREKDRQSTIRVRAQKLKCFINYFDVMMSRDYSELQKDILNFQKVSTSLNSKSLREVDQNMSSVQIQRGYIEQHYKQSIMIDFSNKHIGGGVLTNGAVQQQILFCIFPELVVSTCLCDQIKDNEAVVITNAERINNYSGYSDQFTFEGTYKQKDEGPFLSTIVAIDAIDYNEKLGKQLSQYTASSIQRELIKAISGIGGAELLSDADMPVCTGRWGCGAFKGNIYLKFVIQWIACSLAKRKMIYKAQDQQQQSQLKTMVKYLRKHMTSQIIQAIQQYNSVLKKSKKLTFLDFLKKQIS